MWELNFIITIVLAILVAWLFFAVKSLRAKVDLLETKLYGKPPAPAPVAAPAPARKTKPVPPATSKPQQNEPPVTPPLAPYVTLDFFTKRL